MSTATVAVADERLARTSGFAKLLRRPEVGAAVAAILLFIAFSVGTSAFLTPAGASTWLYSSSLFGIMAVGVALLMIGGEFDLSAGAMTGATGLAVGITTTTWGLNIWVAILVSLAMALAVGFVNGYILVKTGVPSFIITLATFFVLQGVNLAVTKLITGAVAISGMTNVPSFEQPRAIFGSTISIGGFNLKVAIIWWVAILAVASWVLLRTRVGNWIFAVGGAPNSARQVGVPVTRVRIGLFMTTATCGWLVGMLMLFDVTTVQATTGVGQEFIYIICAVVGGCMLTGGYGSVIGPAFGALIYGMTYQGIVFAGWDSNWLKAILGILLLAAVLVNLYVRRTAGAKD
ncbi:ABC transporter permease [Microbacterium oleivorans]|uniref:Xylose transport system permease protein XylH n=2 Tax=Microbacterium oleivorans TaxID=273677 RepID=A0A7D5EYK3_9MICO|nr:ABC transporter permease [Microbacterium oleivorans]QLD12764.1 ABC transporter permease [Microbacterium oleivorans]